MATIKRFIYIVFSLLLVFVLVYSTLGLALSQIAYNSPNQHLFVIGQVPNPYPDGVYKGTADNQGTWTGMTFNAADATGINNFKEGDNFKFTTYLGKGVQDADKDVLKLDYNVEDNPFYIRFFQQEIVQTATGEYLGKLQLRIIPFIPFVIGFFTLQK